ncbi:MAG TPA: hypothetical protein VEC08_04660, partial [Nitrososphaerales archaeon]|nr:hypothetical protein [Nitrososphaerales archaeon]
MGNTRLTTANEMLQSPSVSLVELKRLALQLLPTNSSLRAILLSQPDFIPKQEAYALMPIFVMLLYKEIGG